MGAAASSFDRGRRVPILARHALRRCRELEPDRVLTSRTTGKSLMKQAADITTKKATESLFLLNLVLIR